MKIIITIFTILLSSEAQAASSYYPTKYQEQLLRGQLRATALKNALFQLLVKKHIQRNGRNDELVDNCGENLSNKGRCYGHKDLGYRAARKILFGRMHLEEDSRGYFIKDVYCRKEFTNRQTQVGPNIIPNSNLINAEHTWPQSKFSRRFSKSLQKSDLNHLYPTDSRANSVRGNYEFANVDGGQLGNGCSASRSGHAKASANYFEPPNEQKGNVARALFYFSTRYQIAISKKQEKYLRQWMRLDPVDAQERNRNEWIYKTQGNRNPFIDYPHLAELIRNF